jgi:NAD(P)-dependent dehydrogenase (short-subunit alcohol dehydrogenase family)
MEFKGYNTDFSLEGRVALITGGAAGIGRAIAELFYQKGANLVLSDISPSVADTAEEIAPDASRVVTVQGDITKAEGRQAAVDAAINTYGSVDILVNCAGIALLDSALEVTEARWDLTMDLNLKSVFFLSQLVAPHMIEKGTGKIINLASQAGIIALDKHAVYVASKAAVIGLTKVLALEWARQNIQSNCISPTVVLTELGKKAWAGEVGEIFKEKIPAGRFAYPEEIAACALFLASDAAQMINGANLVIDGGYTIQ